MRLDFLSPIDFIVERGERLLPIDIESSDSVRVDNASAVDAFCVEFADRAPFGIVIYNGRDPVALTERVIAVPLSRLL